MKHKLLLMVSTVASLAISSLVSIAQDATPLGQFQSWVALTHTDANGKYCFATSIPQKYEPPERRHGKVVFFVTNRPSNEVKNEPSITVGYPFKENTKVDVNVDGTSYTMFTHEDSAWMNENEKHKEQQLIQAMKAGNTVIVSGESARGTKTKYTFSLSGVTAAINEIDKNCS